MGYRDALLGRVARVFLSLPTVDPLLCLVLPCRKKCLFDHIGVNQSVGGAERGCNWCNWRTWVTRESGELEKKRGGEALYIVM